MERLTGRAAGTDSELEVAAVVCCDVHTEADGLAGPVDASGDAAAEQPARFPGPRQPHVPRVPAHPAQPPVLNLVQQYT